MNEYKLTVVTTTYNHGKYIEQCLKSILNQKKGKEDYESCIAKHH